MHSQYITAAVFSIWQICTSAQASTAACRPPAEGVTPAGAVKLEICSISANTYETTLYLNGAAILRDDQLFEQASNANRIIYESGSTDPTTNCAAKMYLLDLSNKPAKIVAFGVKNSCIEFDWASWGKRRSVIALKHNVRFVYEDGKMKPPKVDEKLWTSIEAPHGPASNVADDIVPFVENVPPPKE